jgi:NTP pyrophosphatase (non-canonical NTP hydrolase)
VIDLQTLQSQVNEIEIKRGHRIGTSIQKCLLLGEEYGELCKAIREKEKMSIHTKTERYSVEDELADCLFLIVGIANRYGIDLEEAFMEKMRKDDEKKYVKVI